MAHKFPHGVPGRPNGRYDATVSDLAFAAPAADKGKVSEGLWTGRNSNDARTPPRRRRPRRALRGEESGGGGGDGRVRSLRHHHRHRHGDGRGRGSRGASLDHHAESRGGGGPTAAGWPKSRPWLRRGVRWEGTTSSVFDDEKTETHTREGGRFRFVARDECESSAWHTACRTSIRASLERARLERERERVRLKRLRSASPRPSVRVVALRMPRITRALERGTRFARSTLDTPRHLRNDPPVSRPVSCTATS